MAGHKVVALGVSGSYELAGRQSTHWRFSTILVFWGVYCFVWFQE